MIPMGKTILTIYSILVVMGFIVKEMKGGDKGWKGALLIPILILLINI